MTAKNGGDVNGSLLDTRCTGMADMVTLGGGRSLAKDNFELKSLTLFLASLRKPIPNKKKKKKEPIIIMMMATFCEGEWTFL